MKRRTWVLLPLAVVLTAVNFLGAGWALFVGEMGHALLHVVLLAPSAYLLARVWPPPRLRANAHHTPDRLDYLQQSVDAIALEIERIGEAQRFNDRLADELKQSAPADSKS